MIRQVHPAQGDGPAPRLHVIGWIAEEGVDRVRASGVRFDHEDAGPLSGAVVETGDGERFGLLRRNGRPSPGAMLAARHRDEEPARLVERFRAAAGLAPEHVEAAEHWPPAEGHLVHDAVRWQRVDVAEDDRTLTFHDVQLPPGEWFHDGARLEEYPDVVLASVSVRNDRHLAKGADPPTARLSEPLAGRPVLDASRGRLVRPAPADGEHDLAVWDEAWVPCDGVVVVAWSRSMIDRLTRVDADVATRTVTLHVARTGGKLGRDRYLTVVQAPGLAAGATLRDGALD